MGLKECSKPGTHKGKKRPPRQRRNPIETAITSWHEKHAAHLKIRHDVGELIAQAPKRWTAYGPLVLLPTGSFASLAWRDVLDSTSSIDSSIITSGNDSERTDEEGGNSNSTAPALLWKAILEQISGSSTTKLTHLAINEGIPLHSKENSGETETGTGTRRGRRDSENILRSPSGMRLLYGDFGPSKPSPSPSLSASSTPRGREGGGGKKEESDFSRAFWVSTKQNGITQTWAPRWTMFSRGNIKEKARLLSFHDDADDNDDDGVTEDENDAADEQKQSRRHQRSNHAGAVAVDLYAGIGYFAFCYAALGFRVLCWELNAWSVEGLRRGAEANGWGVRVVVPAGRGRGAGGGNEGEDEREEKEEDKAEDEEEMLRNVLAGDETIIVFLEDNKRAARRIRKLDELTREREKDGDGSGPPAGSGGGGGGGGRGLRMRDVMHVNCGLLPSSRGSWDAAWEIASRTRRAWVHVHENVGVADIEARKREVGRWFAERARDEDGDGIRTRLCVEHVEMVKTFAPGVWHCVFDLCIKRDRDGDGADDIIT
ncbi:S-adenosyl-L-methionine-dependent methyltransferase [Nemania serpens]|nr:S-adenosyl-L-methionine-dependent methyltransferase [Nemania serpens]